MSLRHASITVIVWALASEGMALADSPTATIGLLPASIPADLTLPLGAHEVEDAVAQGLATSGRDVLPPSRFDLGQPNQVNESNADYFVRVSLSRAGPQAVRIWMTLFNKGGKKLNQQVATCQPPDCSLGVALRLAAKELTRVALPASEGTATPDRAEARASAASPEPPVDPVVRPLEPVPTAPAKQDADRYRIPAAVGLGAGAALMGVGAWLVAIDGNGTECRMAPSGDEACFKVRDTMAVGSVVGAVGLGAALASAYYLMARPTAPTRVGAAVSLTPTPQGVQVWGRF